MVSWGLGLRICAVLSLLTARSEAASSGSSSSSTFKFSNSTSSASSSNPPGSSTTLSTSTTSSVSSTLSSTSSNIKSSSLDTTASVSTKINGTNQVNSTAAIVKSSIANSTITAPPSTTTDCNDPIPFEALLNPAILLMPDSERGAYLQSAYGELLGVYSTFVRLKAEPATEKTKAEFSTYSISLKSQLSDVATKVFGQNGLAKLSLSNYVLSGQFCLFQTCFTQYNARSSALGGQFDPFDWGPSAPCCADCTVYGAGVQLTYW
ncbi:hypothetical protein BGZ60DRAFT_78338 [Tricladium varicosporioides]|nr:hypothetical protein BGZ60DRAFT_78338 [Hymenoscyphus varicosporioides]